jgi:hypothetical protein
MYMLSYREMCPTCGEGVVRRLQINLSLIISYTNWNYESSLDCIFYHAYGYFASSSRNKMMITKIMMLRMATSLRLALHHEYHLPWIGNDFDGRWYLVVKIQISHH